ncbi:type I DNA topoisomerase [Methylovirgula sp. 4M-Z18]|uniref:type I DNA topoisomerase n=1 Tax=Methylovirgula sp. 4M-Z18 TaxID=2293567 RepID=UPI000E2F78A2|nr:type I DNA topoisomerase [Methylovirgula sp. 4M-Z18]RFB80666.1 type I DNA topoisomerase [Methylovirgula sp. 4M-Z18]
MNVVIVESPAKAKTINKYLGKNYEVLASFGHVRDLPAKDGSVDPDHDFKMLWEVDAKSSKRLADIAKLVKDSDTVILATDPDREGEAISWHVLEVLKAKRVLKDKKIQRVVFNAITKDAVLDAMKHPRDIDVPLVDAYLARRALDYLVGFNLSPVLWRKLPGARSAGRVQSVALRLVSDRELEIEKFVKREYWSITAHLKTLEGGIFTARLSGADGKKLTRLDIGTGAEAEAFKSALDQAKFTVASVEAKPVKRHPYPPFRTSTLQQEAARKLGLSPARTMQLAQRLYEGIEIGGETVGLITYMRTDGVDVAPEAITAARKVIAKEYGDEYVPGVPRKYSVKAKNAQEAHEAIRPTDLGRLPRMVSKYLDTDLLRLYELVWKRTVASQMESAELERTTVDIIADAGKRQLELRATGQVVRFDGFLVLYDEGKDDAEDEESARLPPMQPRDALRKERIETTQHFTQPPPRYTEASLVKRLEELGIGRPSTYAAILAVLRERDYVRLEKKQLIPEDKGRLLTAFLESFFTRYVEYNFTADLEEKLDLVSNNELDYKKLLSDFWKEFSAAVDGTKELRTTQILDNLNELLGPHIFPAKEDGSDPRGCPSCGNGQLSLKLGKFGAFIGCSNYPECKFTRQLAMNGEDAQAVEGGDQPGVKVLGQDPETGEDVSLRDGRFGPYVQLGDGEKPKRSSLPRGMTPATLTLEQAVGLLSLPRVVANHPETGEPIKASIGRFGPYVQHGKTYASLGKDDNVLEIGANRAIDLIVAKESGAGGGRFGRGAQPGRALGDHPKGGAVSVKDGRYGAYVNWGKVNATLPKDVDAATIDLPAALALLDAKASGKSADSAVTGRLLGEHPNGGPVTVRDGRYGAYVNWGKINATLPKGTAADAVSLMEALELIEEKGGAPAKASSTKAAVKKAPAKKATTKKAAPKKAAGKKAPAKKAAAKK